MAELQCVICDYTVPKGDQADEVLALLGASTADAGADLVSHMEGHTLADWVRAFQMADRYIEQLEGELAEARREPQWQTNPIATHSSPFHSFEPGPAPVGDIEYAKQPGFSADDAELLRRYTPREVAAIRRRSQIQSAIDSHDPDQTFIPRIPDAQRPEGVVGVKY